MMQFLSIYVYFSDSKLSTFSEYTERPLKIVLVISVNAKIAYLVLAVVGTGFPVVGTVLAKEPVPLKWQAQNTSWFKVLGRVSNFQWFSEIFVEFVE